MNMLVTLFGGVVLVVLIYQVLRALGFSNYWRGVISGVVPLVAYAIYATGNWAGLDVLAIHTAVYLSAATVLTMLGAREAEKSSGKKAGLHWAPKAFIAFFLVILLLDGTFLYVSTQGLPSALAKWILPGADQGGVNTAFPGVVPHGQEAAKEIASELSARHREMRLGWRVEVEGFDALARDGQAQIVVHALERDGSPMNDAKVTLTLLRPAQAKHDVETSMPLSGSGQYQAWTKISDIGRWIAIVRVVRGDDEYKTEQQLTVNHIK